MPEGHSLCYFDASVILRYAVNHSGAIRKLHVFTKQAFTSSITAVECLRALDRWRLTGKLSESDLAEARVLCLKILQGLGTVKLDDQVAEFSAQSFPIAMNSLEAIHLATALLVQKEFDKPVKVLTHDVRLGLAAKSMGLVVVDS